MSKLNTAIRKTDFGIANKRDYWLAAKELLASKDGNEKEIEKLANKIQELIEEEIRFLPKKLRFTESFLNEYCNIEKRIRKELGS